MQTALGPEVWNHALIVFTFSNQVPREKFEKAVEVRTRLIREQIARWAAPGVAESIPSVPVDNFHEYTHDNRQWLGRLYMAILRRVSRNGAQPFTIMVLDRLVVEDSDSQKTHVSTGGSYGYSGGGSIRVSKSEFREALASTWEGITRLVSVSATKAKSVIESGWSRVKKWFS